MDDEARKELAIQLFQQAYQHQMNKELDEAVELYKKSIDSYPTAEAHTFLGWTYSWMGRIDDAIAECHKAIEVDPTFGNPYNDIGSYLIDQGPDRRSHSLAGARPSSAALRKLLLSAYESRPCLRSETRLDSGERRIPEGSGRE